MNCPVVGALGTYLLVKVPAPNVPHEFVAQYGEFVAHDEADAAKQLCAITSPVRDVAIELPFGNAIEPLTPFQ